MVVARSILIWDQMQTIRFCIVSKIQPDLYLFPSYQRNIHRLEEAIDGAISVGLFEDIIGDIEHSVVLHNAFVQNLAEMETLDRETAEIDEWIKQHFTMGMVRLLDRCIQLHHYAFPKGSSDRITREIEPLRKKAWTYLGQRE